MQVRQVRKKRPAPPTDAEDEEEEFDAAAAAIEIAQDDARERKLTSVSLWQVFLYHSRRAEKDEVSSDKPLAGSTGDSIRLECN